MVNTNRLQNMLEIKFVGSYIDYNKYFLYYHCIGTNYDPKICLLDRMAINQELLPLYLFLLLALVLLLQNYSNIARLIQLPSILAQNQFKDSYMQPSVIQIGGNESTELWL